MPKAETCTLAGKHISVDEALRRREAATGTRVDFRCNECGEAVRPHKESTHGAAHFEHLQGNPSCKLSESA